MPTVSYVATLYNKRPFLPHLLAGLAAQEGPFRKQFVFVDDGSTDDTVAALKQMTAGWADTIVIEQKNAGPAVAMNAGIAAATGDFIKPMDGDDMLAPWGTRYLLDAIAESGCPVAYADFANVGTYVPGEAPEKALSGFDPGALRVHREHGSLKRSLRNAGINPSAWLATADIVRRTGGCDEGVFIQDYSAELRLSAATDFARIDNTLVFAPREAEGRLMGNEAQILHDCNLAVIRFLRDARGLDARLKTYGMRRAAGRAWAWARRRGGKTMFSRAFAYHVRALLGLLSPTEEAEDALCAPFRATARIRLTGRA